ETGGIDLVVHTGDVFHQSRPSWSALLCFITQTQRLAALNCPVVIIAGNHDISQLRTAETVFSVLRHALPFVTFVAGATDEVIALDAIRTQLVAIPHSALATVEPGVRLAPDGYRNILLTHGLAPTLADTPRREAGETTLTLELLSPGYDAILLGHFHADERVMANTWYAGSTERIGWNDADTNPGWSLVTLPDQGPITVEHISIATRPMRDVVVRDAEGRDAREIADDVLRMARQSAPEGAMIRADLTGLERGIRRSAEGMIRRDAAEEFFWIQTYSRSDQSLIGSETETASRTEPMQGLPQLLRQYCEEEIADASYRQHFLTRGLQALEAVIAAADPPAEVGE
ncbi:MAG TPA: metallophosphoesterase, partial [Thermomicrobiales bacterium]|nr:metallophosphoesterase [Thermomicrobiales bacterium]